MIGNSPNRDEYIALMKAGWSSAALERYAMWRHDEYIPASTFRGYRWRKGKKWPVSTATYSAPADAELDRDTLLDLLHERAELIRLQKSRVRIDVEHERNMGKLFGSTAREIEVLNRLLDSSKADLQDLGLFPKAGTRIELDAKPGDLAPHPQQGQLPAARTLGEVLGTADPEASMQLARALHEFLPRNGNGQVVEGELGD